MAGAAKNMSKQFVPTGMPAPISASGARMIQVQSQPHLMNQAAIPKDIPDSYAAQMSNAGKQRFYISGPFETPEEEQKAWLLQSGYVANTAINTEVKKNRKKPYMSAAQITRPLTHNGKEYQKGDYLVVLMDTKIIYLTKEQFDNEYNPKTPYRAPRVKPRRHAPKPPPAPAVHEEVEGGGGI